MKNDVVKKSLLSLLAGIMCLALIPCTYTVDGAYDAYIYIPIVLCLWVGMLWGVKYSLMASIGLIYPFFIWVENGYVNLVTTLLLVVWLLAHSKCRSLTLKKKIPFFSIYICQLIFLLILLFGTNFLCHTAVKLNPTFWSSGYEMRYISDSIINVNKILLAEITTILVLTVNILLSLSSVKKLVGLKLSPYKNKNGLICLCMLIIILVFSTVTTSTQSSMLSISFSVNSYKSAVGNTQLMLAKILFVMLASDFTIHFLEYKNEIRYREKLSSEKYQNIFKNILDIYIELTPDCIIKSVSPSAEKVFMLERKALVGKNFTEFFENKQALLNCVNDTVNAKDLEFRIHTSDGTAKWLLTSEVSFSSKDTVIFIARDITKRKLVEARNYEMASIHRAIVESSDDLIFLLRNEKILSLNKAAREFFRFHCNNEEPTNFSAIWTADEYVEWSLMLSEASRKKKYIAEYSDNVTGKYFELHFTVINRGSTFDDISVFAKDITFEKNKEEQSRLMKEELEYRVLERTKELTTSYNELEKFTAIVTHEFRSPVRAISLYNDILREELGENPSEDGTEAVDSIHSYCEKSLEMIKNMLDYAKLKSRKISVQRVDINLIITDCVNELRVLYPEQDIRLVTQELPVVIGDEFLLHHVVYNILANSVKYSSKKEFTQLTVSCKTDKDNNIFTFSDNGEGFDMENAKGVFGLFNRMHTDSEFKGTGVGLAAVKNIIEKHGGKVDIFAQKNKGCTVTFFIPK